MSFILDALKKSERERESSVTAKLGSAPTEISHAKLEWNWSVAAIVMLAAGLVAMVLLRTEPQPTTNSVPPVTRAESRVANPAPARPSATRSLAGEAGSVPRRRVRTAVADSTPAPDTSVTSTTGITLYTDLATAVRQQLGPLHVDAHAYSMIRSERFVLINLKRYHEGNVTSGGATVREITPEGVIMTFQGSLFFLPRN